MEAKNNLYYFPQAYLTAGEINISANRAIVSAARVSGEKLAGSLAGDFSFAQVLAQENERQRKMQDLRLGHGGDLRKVSIIY
jgi:hypothetical protein